MLIRCRVPAEEGLFSFLMVVLLCLHQQDWEHHPFVRCECTAPKSLHNLFVCCSQAISAEHLFPNRGDFTPLC